MADTDSDAVKSSPKRDRPRVRDGVDSVVWLFGKPAHNRHATLRSDVYDRAMAQAEVDEVSLAEVTRTLLGQYAEQAPAAARVASTTDGTSLPAQGREALTALWKAGDEQRINAYLAACAQSGWTLSVLARAMVASGLVPSMSRQAVSQRVAKAPAEVPEDLPAVPPAGPTRRKFPTQVSDFSYRIGDKEYDEALARATYEGAQILAVVEDLLDRYADRRLSAVLDDGRTLGRDPEQVPVGTPEHLAHLPAAALREAKRRAKGDWSLVSLAGDDLHVEEKKKKS